MENIEEYAFIVKKNVENKDQLICHLANVIQARLERSCTI
jgi:hypothetical protein